MNNIVLDGYHITDAALCENIIRNGFTYNSNPKHYLGQGIYFYNDFDIAKLNVQSKKINYGSTNKKAILHCTISTLLKQFLDLDSPSQNTKFRKFWNEFLEYIEKNNIQLTFQNKKDFLKNKHLYYKCYVLDLYKKVNNYNVVVKTFSIDTPSYGESIYNLNFSGLPYLEKYICVSKSQLIHNTEVVHFIEAEEDLFI